MIKLDMYRGIKVPTKHGSDLIVYEQPLWMTGMKSEVSKQRISLLADKKSTRLCIR